MRNPAVGKGCLVAVAGLLLGVVLRADAQRSKPGEVEAWLAKWPTAVAGAAVPPLSTADRKLPYQSAAGRQVLERVNRWYAEGSASGLSQDAFRSYCAGHSNLSSGSYPQLRVLPPVDGGRGRGALVASQRTVFRDRVTFGVRSEGMSGPFADGGRLVSVIEYATRSSIHNHYRGRQGDVQDVLESFYRRNFVFAVPAVGTFDARHDGVTFLSPFYLHSVGHSGSDKALLHPLILASASVPPALKTRIVRSGLLVPTLMQLFRDHYAGGLRSDTAHLAAFGLPPEAGADWPHGADRLSALVDGAHGLTHIPPVARLGDVALEVEDSSTPRYASPAYARISPHHVAVVLRPGETLDLDVSLSESFVDAGKSIRRCSARLLRGPGELSKRSDDGDRWHLRVPWSPSLHGAALRTDVVLLVNDGTYDSAPAYVSVKHVQPFERSLLGQRGLATAGGVERPDAR